MSSSGKLLSSTNFDLHFNALRVMELCMMFTEHLFATGFHLMFEQAMQAAKDEFKHMQTTKSNFKEFVCRANLQSFILKQVERSLRFGPELDKENTHPLSKNVQAQGIDRVLPTKCRFDQTALQEDDPLLVSRPNLLNAQRTAEQKRVQDVIASMPPFTQSVFVFVTCIKPLLQAGLDTALASLD